MKLLEILFDMKSLGYVFFFLSFPNSSHHNLPPKEKPTKFPRQRKKSSEFANICSINKREVFHPTLLLYLTCSIPLIGICYIGMDIKLFEFSDKPF